MRGLRFILLLALVVLGGCASSSTTGVCARVPDLSRELAWPSFQALSIRHKNAGDANYRTPRDVAVPRTAKDETPEPRFTSTEWWMRENARLARATIICRGCAPAVVATIASSKPAVLTLDTDVPVPGASMSRVEGTAGPGGPQQP
jgi:hypothetical protein